MHSRPGFQTQTQTQPSLKILMSENSSVLSTRINLSLSLWLETGEALLFQIYYIVLSAAPGDFTAPQSLGCMRGEVRAAMA